MRKLLLLVAVLSLFRVTNAQMIPSTDGFQDCVHHWMMEHGDKYERYKPDQFREIANNIVAYQNPDGGWSGNIDVMARVDPDSIRMCMDAQHLQSTLDNTNVYPQVEYLSTVFYLTGDSLYCRSAARGMDFMLSAQRPDGSWGGQDAVSAFNDNTMTRVLSLWIDVLQDTPIYTWVGGALKENIRASYDRGVDRVLRCQYVRNGVKTIWPQQCNHATQTPAGDDDPSSLAPDKSAGITLMLMKIGNPSPAVSAAVRAAVAWFERAEYGLWSIAVLKEYPQWLVRTAKEAAEAGKDARKAARKAARQART